MQSGGLHCVWSPRSVPQHDSTTHGRRPHNRILCGRLVCAVVRSAFSITGRIHRFHLRPLVLSRRPVMFQTDRPYWFVAVLDVILVGASAS